MSDAAACVPNIGSKEIRKRLRRATIMLAVGVGVAALVVLSGVERGWRLALLAPFWLAALDYFQAREKTWVVLAARGARKLDQKKESIEDKTVILKVRRQARKVHVLALTAAAAVTALCLALPL